MGFNYALEKLKFDKEWEKLHDEYSAAGMSEAAIAQMKAFDWGWFCSRRLYSLHNQPLPEEYCFDEDRASTLFRRFAALSVAFEDDLGTSRYGWLESIEDPRLYQRLKALSDKHLELITLIAIDGYSQAEVARMWGCCRNVIYKKVQRIKKFLQRG